MTTNEEYVDNLLSQSHNQTAEELAQARAHLLEVLAKYGDNHWWESNNKYAIGYYQLNEPYLVVPFDKFHEGLEAIVGRPVYTHELALNVDELKETAQRRWNELLCNHGVPGWSLPEFDEEAMQQNPFVSLVEYCEKNDKPLLAVAME